MLDRDGRVLVDNRPSFSVLLLRDDPVLVDKNLPAISEGLGISIDDLKDNLNTTKNLPKFQPIVIKPEATDADIAFIESRRSDLPVLEMISVSRRRYISGGSWATPAATSVKSANNKSKPVTAASAPATSSAKRPRKTIQRLLIGTDGMRRVIVNSVGKEVGRLSRRKPSPANKFSSPSITTYSRSPNNRWANAPVPWSLSIHAR